MASGKSKKVPSVPVPITEGGTGATYVRTAKQNLQIVGTIATGDDLNNYGDPENAGFYRIRNGVTNSPVSWAGMIVITGMYASDGITQIIFQGNKMYFREKTGNPIAWTAWRTFTLQE